MTKRVLNCVIAAGVAAAFTVGCGTEEAPPPPVGVTEVVTVPIAPSGQEDPNKYDTVTYRTGGAASSLDHPLEYRLDLDSGGPGDFTDWSPADTFLVTWRSSGGRVVRAQARCSIHKSAESEWSDGVIVRVGTVPATEIIRVTNRYWVDGSKSEVDVDFADGVPDTVPYGSWITVYFQGVDSTVDDNCPDLSNNCWRYQMRHDWFSPRDASMFGQTPWLPVEGQDTDLASVVDSMSMNIGTVNYTVHARVQIVFGTADPDPPSFEIAGNFPPSLDDFYLEDPRGNAMADGDTIILNWWEPEDSSLFVRGTQLMKRKTFFFVVRASGHDDPRDASDGLSWRYRFPFVDDPSQEARFARSGAWVDGVTTEALCDTHRYTAEYPESDVRGDAIFIDRPPSWQDRSLDFLIKARDLPTSTYFEQIVIVEGVPRTMNFYITDSSTIETTQRQLRFHIKLVR